MLFFHIFPTRYGKVPEKKFLLTINRAIFLKVHASGLLPCRGHERAKKTCNSAIR
jgi:hypothetical protein